VRAHPFEPDPKEIDLFEPRDFTDLANQLLFAEAGRSGIPPAGMSVTRRMDVAESVRADIWTRTRSLIRLFNEYDGHGFIIEKLKGGVYLSRHP
jgi:hypothetical protein